MPATQNLEITEEGPFTWVALNRVEVRNAFDGETLEELAAVFRSFSTDGPRRVVFLMGKGGVFSAGADLRWMKGEAGADREAIRRGSELLASALHAIDACPLPTVALAEKAVVGGAMGLLAACDFALAAEGTQFRTSEVRLGLAPAVVGPFLLRRLGDRVVRELFLLGEMFDAEKALAFGLILRRVPPGELPSSGRALARSLLKGGPSALAACKAMLRQLPRMTLEEVAAYTASLITDLRLSPEGQEGMAAFLEKRKPRWDEG
ncbi:MAG: enoyl-CoA hydratase-related protein [Planctomycetota bacterium]|jgi:methylglutaconyl-CoA hydratase